MVGDEPVSAHQPEEGREGAVCVLLNRIPYPLDDGWRVRTFQLIRALAATRPVTVIAFGAEDEVTARFREEAGDALRLTLVPPPPRYSAWRLLRGLLGRDPIYVVNERSRAFSTAVAEELAREPATLIFTGLVAMFEHAHVLSRSVPIVVDTHNIDSLLMKRYAEGLPGPARRWYARVTTGKLKRYEDEVLRRASAVVVCSDIEREQLVARVPGAQVWVVPNGASVAHFRPDGTAAVPNRLLFFGRLDYHPNRDALGFFLQEILPLVRARSPGVELHVAGVGADEALVRELGSTTDVVFHGRVDDLPSLVRSAAVVVVPLRLGGGTRLKILEALAAARPVVTTTIGAEGLALESGRHVMVADDPESFAERTASLLENPEAASRLGENGRALIAAEHDWSAVGALLRARCRELPTTRAP